MKFLLCPDSFKGSLTAVEAAEAMQEGISAVFPEAETTILPLPTAGGHP